MLVLLLCGINLMWGSSWVASKLALEEMTPLQLGGWRMIVAAVLLLPWFVRSLRRGEITAGALPWLTFLGFTGFVAPKALNYWGIDLSTAINASLLMAVEPLLTIAMARVWLGERLTGRKLSGLLLGGFGGYLLIARGFKVPNFSVAGVVGDLIFTAGLAMEALYSVWGKATLQRHSPVSITAASIVTSLVFWIPAVAVDGARNGWPAPSWVGLGAIVFLALGCTVIAYMAWLFALGQMEAGTAGMTILLQPLFGALLSAAVLGDTLPPVAAVGGTLVVFSLFVVVREPH
jgi:drug/metabolite transporter (DMT)-like permease